MATKRPTVEEKKSMSQVADYGCVACEQDGLVKPAEIHHIRKHTGMGLRPPRTKILPLCASQQRTGKISVHGGKKAVGEKKGTKEQVEKKERER